MCDWVYGNNGKPICIKSGKITKMENKETGEWFCEDHYEQIKNVDLLIKNINKFSDAAYEQYMKFKDM